ncbi:MAG: hypothetical protein JWO06_1838 [Bacteroidota bacterium]|nr:hypothetical protein [Bacteroidota bacterium]
MRKSILMAVLAMALFAGCKKTDNTTNWLGTYIGNANSSVNQIIITKTDNNTLNIALQTPYNGGFSTYVTLKSVKVNSSTSATVDEYGNIVGWPNQYHFTGTATLSGNALNFTGHATNTVDANDVKYYLFLGSK